MPLINTRYVSGPLDEVVYRVADAAGMPAIVISGFDGAWFAWRWPLSATSAEVRDVILRFRAAAVDRFTAEVAVEVGSFSPVPRRSEWHRVDQRSVASPAAIDEAWLAEALSSARDLASKP
jgi:hypothetical protein